MNERRDTTFDRDDTTGVVLVAAKIKEAIRLIHCCCTSRSTAAQTDKERFSTRWSRHGTIRDFSVCHRILKILRLHTLIITDSCMFSHYDTCDTYSMADRRTRAPLAAVVAIHCTPLNAARVQEFRTGSLAQTCVAIIYLLQSMYQCLSPRPTRIWCAPAAAGTVCW